MELIKNRLKSFLIKLFVAVMGVMLITMRENAVLKISEALTMCADTLIPTLFPFMVLSTFALSCGVFEKQTKIASFIMNKVFRLPVTAMSAVIFGFIGGYPVGARVICKLYENDSISGEDARHLFAFCINAGPAFIVSVAGGLVLGSEKAGYIMFISVLLSSLLTGVIYPRIGKKNGLNLSKTVSLEKDISSSLVNAVTDAAGGIVSVCSWVIAFAGFSAVATYFIDNENLYKIYLSLAEISSGLKAASSIGGIPFLSGCIAFGGVAVTCQILPAIKKCGIKVCEYLFFRIINGISSCFITYLIMKFTDVSIYVVSQFDAKLHSAPASAALLIMCAVLIADVISHKDKQSIFG